MKHELEIKRWAEQPDGTKVWYKKNNGSDWHITDMPTWFTDIIFIVDDQWAELRKAQAEGKQIQVDNYGQNDWEDTEHSPTKNCNFTRWRIKPEPVYEWQWIWRDFQGEYHFTKYCRSQDEARSSFNDSYNTLFKYKDSKRIVSKNDCK